MTYKKIEDEVLACVLKKIDNRKVRKVFYEGNLENIEREKEIESKNIRKDRRLERIQIMIRLKKEVRKKEMRLIYVYICLHILA